MFDILRGKGAEHLAFEAERDFGVRTAGKVDHGASERFVERCEGIAEAAYADAFAQRSIEGSAERQRTVFRGVVIVDLQIARAA